MGAWQCSFTTLVKSALPGLSVTLSGRTAARHVTCMPTEADMATANTISKTSATAASVATALPL
nr:hypothetical protein [uncultured Prevotella sp.]